jgi:hypothetical protein
MFVQNKSSRKDTAPMFTARLLALPVAALLVAVSAPASIAATPTVSVAAAPSPGATTQGIIMSDGRICNPRWGC